MGSAYDEGALTFVREVRPRALVPMHFGVRVDVVSAFARKTNDTKVIQFLARGQAHTLCSADIK